jgi:ParB-like chromosome segregation protein Spo0J
MKTFEPHPLADLFPLLDKDSIGFKALVEDIKANRQHDPVWLLEGKILDGRNRYNACVHLGLDVATRNYIGGDPIGFVLSVNLHRRHLNTSQRAMVAAKLATFTHGGDRSKAPNGALTDAAAAKLLSVGERSVERAKVVLAKGDPSLIEAVEQGKTTVTDAAKAGTEKGPGKGKNEPTASDIYDKVEKKLIEKLQDLKPTEAEAAAMETIKRLKATVATMLKAVAQAA